MELKTLAQLIDIDNYKNNPEQTLLLGLPTFDKNTGGLRRKKLYVWGAPTGSGKTTVMIALATKALLACEDKIMFIATEQEAEEIGARFLSSLTGIEHRRICTGNISDEELEILKEHVHYLDRIVFIFYSDENFNVVKCVENAAEMGIKYVFYDYIGAIPDIGDGQEWKTMIFNADLLKKAAQLNDVYVMAAIQCNYTARKAEETLPDYMDESYFAQSKAVATKADEAAILIKPKNQEQGIKLPTIRIYNIKNRDMEVEPFMEFNLDYSTCRIYEKEKLLFSAEEIKQEKVYYSVENMPKLLANEVGEIFTFDEAIEYIKKEKGKKVNPGNMFNHLNGITKTCGRCTWKVIE